MIARLAKRFQLTGIHIVRRPEQVRKLENLGCENVFDSSDASLQRRLAETRNELKASIAFDAVGGELTGRLALAMPPKSRIVVYGALADEPCQIDSKDFFFRDKKLEGFWLSRWIKRKRFFPKLLLAGRVQKLLSTELQTHVQALEDRIDAKRGDHLLQADSQGTSSVLYWDELKSQLCGLSPESILSAL